MMLVEFLRARLNEDEQTAQAASPGPWSPNAESDEVTAVDGIAVCDGFALSNRQLRSTVEHIARHDPARVLAEVEAKRRIVGMHSPTTLNRRVDGEVRDITACAYDTDPDGAGWTDYPCETLRILASVYADHPDYDPAWRP